MGKTRKYFLLIFIVCLLSLFMIIVAGCNKNTDDSSSSGETPDEPVVSETCVVSFYMFPTDTQPTFTIEVEKKGRIDSTKIQTLTRNGYDFDGWYKDVKFINTFNTNSVIQSDMSVYAKWIAQNTTIYFETFSTYSIAPKQVKIGAEVELPVPNRNNCEFNGWYLDTEYTQSTTYKDNKYYLTATSEITVYAKWTINCEHHYSTEPLAYKAATCTTAGEEACFCLLCGEIKEGTKTTIPALGHEWDETTYYDGGTYHYHKCTRCDEEKDQQSHNWEMNADDDKHWQECNICHLHQEGSEHAHTKVRDESKDVLSTTCGQESVTGYRCSECNHDMSEHHEGVPHTPDGELHHDENGHWNICTKCGAVVNYHTHMLTEVTEQYVKSTCVVHGHRIYHCTCGYDYEEELPLAEHTFRKNNQGSEWVDTANSAGLSPAQQALLEDFDFKICEVCGKECDITEHDFYKEKIYTIATCSQQGRKEVTCRNCGLKKEIITPMTAHTHPADENDITVLHSVSCTADGQIQYSCAKCHQTITETVPAGHDWQTINEATCTVNGLKRCSRCHEEEIVVAHHTFEEGYSWDTEKHWHTCTACGKREDEHAHELERTVYGEWSCDGTITVMYYCTICGYKSSLTEITGPGHNWDAGVKTKDPTCIAYGEITYTCQACGHTRIEYIPMIEHSYDEGSQTRAPTCTVDGVWTYVCTTPGCGHEKYESIPALGHDFENAGTRITDPGCTTTGIQRHHCNHDGCTETQDEILAALGHEWDPSNVVENPKATCTTDGLRIYECTRCHDHISEVVSALGHLWDEGTITTAPTCTETGIRTCHCTRDGCSATEERVEPALGHSYENTVVPPKCETQGYTLHHCTRCGHEERDTYVAALGHNYVATKVIHPTCHMPGYTIYTCTRCGRTKEADLTPVTSHHYEGHVCVYCGDSKISEYLTTFTSHGNSKSDAITINNEEELMLFLDYLCANYISTAKHIVFNSSYVETSNVNDRWLNSNLWPVIKPKMMMVERNFTAESTNNIVSIRCTNSLDTYNTSYGSKIVGDILPPGTSVKQEYYFAPSSTERDETWDSFAYKSYSGSLSCTTSDQLVYALMNCIKPTVASESRAEAVMTYAKALLRTICDDSMTDEQKVVAIYKWLTSNVFYYEPVLDDNCDYDKAYGSNYLESIFGLTYKLNKVTHNYYITQVNVSLRGVHANSMGLAKAMVLLTGLEGIRSTIITGTKSDIPYYWNKVLVDTNDDGLKEWYAIDLVSGIKQIVESENKYDLMSTEGLMVSDAYIGLTATNYSDCVASTMYNYYANEKYIVNEQTYDLFITSQAEMTTLATYITDNNAKTKTYKAISFFITNKSYLTGSGLTYTEISEKAATINNTSGYIVTIAI